MKKIKYQKNILHIIIITILIIIGIFALTISVIGFLNRSADAALTEEEKAGKKADELQTNYLNGDKIIQITPYDSYDKGYKITTSQGEKGINVNIYLYTCDENEIENYKNNALKYFTKNGLNSSKYNITYSNC